MSSTIRHLFLDLEDTVITPVTADGWQHSELITTNIELVKRIITEWNPECVSIFSFALWDKKDLDDFNTIIRGKLEEAIGRKLSFVWTLDDDIVPMSCAEKCRSHGYTTRREVREFWGKQDSFKLCIKHFFQAGARDGGPTIEAMLLDDDVYEEFFSWPTYNIHGSIFNIDNFRGFRNELDRTTGN